MIRDLLPHADRIASHADRLDPTVRWRPRRPGGQATDQHLTARPNGRNPE
ncbi:hypothetical protein GCM10020000_55800 [Streptomyces olivoverticillatus]